MLFSYEGFGTQLKDYGLFLMAAMISVGQYVAGVHFIAENLNHTAIFNNAGTNTYESETRGYQHLGWIVIANGMSNFNIRYHFPKGALNNVPGQMVFYSMDPDLVDANIRFEVHRDFRPTVITETSSKELPRGQKMTDRVISDLNAANGDE